MRRVVVCVLALLAAGLVLPAESAAQAAPWVTVELRPLVEGQSTYVRDVNDVGVSVGASGGAVGTPVRWDATGHPTALPVPVGCQGAVNHINAAGQMLGFANCPNNPVQQRLRWRADGTLVPTQPGWPNMAINDGGYVAGVATIGNERGPAIQPFEGGTITMLEDGGVGFASVSDMTSYGYIVGNVNRSTNDSPPFLPTGWIGPYVFPLSFAADAWGTAVSEPGWALLEVRENMRSYGVLVGPGGAVVTLHHTPQTSDELVDLNDRNIVLGYRSEPSATGLDIYGAFYGTQGLVPLRSLANPTDAAAWDSYRVPMALNNDAWVVGVHSTSPTQSRSWLLHPAT